MISLFFLTLALIATVIYFWRHHSPSQTATRNQRTKVKKKESAVAGAEILSEALITEQLCKNDDDNVREIKLASRDPLMSHTAEVADRTPKKQILSEQPDYVVAVYLLAKEGETYSGYELLQALLSAGLRYGDRSIFHRHTHKDGHGDVLFHCASATSPGTFDLSKMGSFSGRGICLFFSANEVNEPLVAFDCLMETLDQLVDDLGGKVLDQKRLPFTRETLMQHRQYLRSIENNKTTVDMFS